MIPPIALDRPTGPAGAPLLVLGPSLGTSTIVWEPAARLLREHVRVAAWDLPGHGIARPAEGPFTVADLADAVAQGLAELGEARVVYAGISLGGAVGIELALRHPELVAGLAIICSGARIAEPAHWTDRAAAVRSTGTAALVVPSAQRWFAPGSMERSPDIAGRLLHALRDADDESYARCCEALAGFDDRERLGPVGAPVLALWGEHDGVVGEPEAALVAGRVAHGLAERVADAGHLAPAEQPAAVAERLIRFIREEIA
jgi:3-oxoadipate enol-lactonase